MKKLSKLHLILMALLIVALAGSAYFLFSYQKVEATQPDLETEIMQAMMKLELAKEENNPAPLKEQLDELLATIDIMKGGEEPLFPKRPPTVQIGDLIVDRAQKLNLTLLKLSPEDKAGTVTIKSGADSEGNKYSKATYDVKVGRDLGRINSLIGEIEGADFATLTIEDIKITLKEEEKDDLTIKFWEAEFTVVTLYEYEEED